MTASLRTLLESRRRGSGHPRLLRSCLAAFALLPVPLASGAAFAQDSGLSFPVPRIPYAPRQYLCSRAPGQILVDGALDEDIWKDAPWTEPFVDIEGSLKPAPRFSTRVKMAWDERCFYVAAEMEEPALWATMTQRDAVIFHENDFEVFLDPDGDTHEYYELELNALNTVWDLLLIRPYRDGGPPVNGWDIAGLRTAVKLDGTLNNPADHDRGWTVEIAFPWTALAECAHRRSPPGDGDQWRVNFSRVEWQLDIVNGEYVRRKDPGTGRNLPEDNWVWSPQGLIAMHYPEMWGVVQFSSRPPLGNTATVRTDPDAGARWALRQLYYSERSRLAESGAFTSDLKDLLLPEAARSIFNLQTCGSGFQASLPSSDQKSTLYIREDGRSWREDTASRD